MKKYILGLALLATVGAGCAAGDSTATIDVNAEASTVRVGYFANLTHAQALIGLEDGTFQKQLGDAVKIEGTTFSAGPAEIEALLAGSIDIGYVGPSPALNGYIQSGGEALKIVSGSMSGGAVLVVQPELAQQFVTQGPSALAGKKIASPQQGNTQDISLRTYLADHGLTDSVQVVPIANADQLTQFSQKQLDGSWAPEPWGSRLMQEAGAEMVLDETDLWPNHQFSTTVIVVRTDFLNQYPGTVKKWLAGQVAVTDWTVAHPDEAKTIVNSEITRLTTKGLSASVLDAAWKRLTPTVDPLKDSISTFADRANTLGFLDGGKPDILNLYDLTALNALTGKQY